MPRYRIQTFGGASIGAFNFSFSGVSLLIEDRDTRQTAIYDLGSGDYGKSPWPIGLTLISSWSEFESPCAIQDFEGGVLLYGLNAGKSASGMRFISGCAKGKFINTGGTQISTPGASGSIGYMSFKGMFTRPVRSFAQDDFSVAIWYPIGGIDPWNRKMLEGIQSLSYWGYLDMSTVVNKDSTAAIPTFTWKWNPYSNETLASALMSSRSGMWSMGSLSNPGSNDATLVEGSWGYFGSNDFKDFGTLNHFSSVMNDEQGIMPNTFDSAAKIRDQTNGTLANIGIIWFLTKERSVA